MLHSAFCSSEQGFSFVSVALICATFLLSASCQKGPSDSEIIENARVRGVKTRELRRIAAKESAEREAQEIREAEQRKVQEKKKQDEFVQTLSGSMELMLADLPRLLKEKPAVTVAAINRLNEDMNQLEKIDVKRSAFFRKRFSAFVDRHRKNIDRQIERARIEESLQTPALARRAIVFELERASLAGAKRAYTRARRKFPDQFAVNPVPELLKTTVIKNPNFIREKRIPSRWPHHKNPAKVCFSKNSFPAGWRGLRHYVSLTVHSKLGTSGSNDDMRLPHCWEIDHDRFGCESRVLTVHFESRRSVSHTFVCP